MAPLINYGDKTRAAIARMIERNPELERDIYNVAELAYRSIEDSLGEELRSMSAIIEELSDPEGQDPWRIIAMAQEMIGAILHLGELGAEGHYITKYSDVLPEDVQGIIDKIYELPSE